MPASEITATSVVPPPISTTILLVGSVMGNPAPIAAAMGSSMRKTSLAPADSADSRTARFSTWVIPEGTQAITRGLIKVRRLFAFLMKYRSITSATSKSAMTPSFIGRIASMCPGVRPSIILASCPTASTLLPPRPFLRTATTEGSFRTMPLPLT